MSIRLSNEASVVRQPDVFIQQSIQRGGVLNSPVEACLIHCTDTGRPATGEAPGGYRVYDRVTEICVRNFTAKRTSNLLQSWVNKVHTVYEPTDHYSQTSAHHPFQ